MKKLFKSKITTFLVNLNSIYPGILGFYYRNIYKPSQKRLSGKLFEFSEKYQHQINFVQIGANDGFSNDPIFKPISAFRWQGIRLEPQPFVFTKLKKLHKNQKFIRLLQYALGEKDGVSKMYCVGFSDKRWAHGLTTFDKATLLQTLKSKSVIKAAKSTGEVFPINENNWIKEIEVKTICVNSLREKYAINHYKLLVVDAEGYDLAIIKLFNDADFLPVAILFEHVNLGKNDLDFCYEMLKQKGYKIDKFGANTFAEKSMDNSEILA